MRGHELLDKLSLVDPAFIEAAETAQKTKKRRALPGRLLPLAACLALALGALALVRSAQPLPKLSADSLWYSAGDIGLFAYDISEITDANPWRADQRFDTLPVYKNLTPLDSGGSPLLPVELDALYARLDEVAARLGRSRDDFDVEEFGGGYLYARGENISVTVDAELVATVWFEPALALPEAYVFTYDASYGELYAAAEYLRDEYAALIPFDNAQIDICGGDRDIDGRQSYEVWFYCPADTQAQALVNYCYERARFMCNDEGALCGVRLYDRDLSEKLGDYPLITLQQAKELFLRGDCLAPAPDPLPAEADIVRCEPVYSNMGTQTYFMPYYCFWLETEDDMPQELLDLGLKCYERYYVPAVDPAYLQASPAPQMYWS